MAPSVSLARWDGSRQGPWLMMLAGLAALYGPTMHDLLSGPWLSDQQGHGPIILLLVGWLIRQRWSQVDDASLSAPVPRLAWSVLFIACAAYVIGRSQGVLVLEVGSLIPLLAGMVLLLRGPRQLRAVAFPLIFLCFMVPLPGAIVDAVTMPVKLAVSATVGQLLYWAGLPISLSGVLIQIGPYQLLVADACAGLTTLFTLEALGFLYLNIVRSSSTARNVILAILIVPISFMANVIRVMTLVLITYYLGDAAGQGFLHGFAGLLLFVTALLLTLMVDGLLQRRLPGRGSAHA